MNETLTKPPTDAEPKVDPAPPSASPKATSWRTRRPVLVLQGGGALGSYQGGVCEGMARAGMQPSWVAGISIGAINAALIAGNPPERRVERLRSFWETASAGSFFAPMALDANLGRAWINQMSAACIATFGVPGFFAPRFPGPLMAAPGSADALSFYDTGPLRATLEAMVDFDRINRQETRLSVGAVDIETGNNVLFDNTKMTIRPEHIMASGALPPGFPPVWIEGRPYWDGGLVSNTPLEFVLDDDTHEDLLIFQVDLFNARGPLPRNLIEADEREKDIRFSSRTRLNTDQNLRIHRFKGALRRLLDAAPDAGDDEDRKLLNEAARENAVAVVQLIYRKRAYEGGLKDFEFSRQTMLEHWSSGLSDVEHCFAHADALLASAPSQGTVVIDPGLHDRPIGAAPHDPR